LRKRQGTREKTDTKVTFNFAPLVSSLVFIGLISKGCRVLCIELGKKKKDGEKKVLSLGVENQLLNKYTPVPSY